MKGYDKIGVYGRKIFNATHKRHLLAMGKEQRKHYERDQVESIRANNLAGHLEVRFKNGELFKYTPQNWF